MALKMFLAVLVIGTAVPALSQVAPAARGGSLPIAVGVGFSDFYTEMIAPRMKGTTVWADWSNRYGPTALHGLGIEAEFRDLNFGQPSNTRLRLVTAGGGPIYTWRHYRKIHPYAKFLVDYADMDFSIPQVPYTRDHWAIFTPGGGVEYRAFQNVWVRADYEYQFWRVGFFNNNFLNPEGFTIGVAYDFGRNR